jgi:hypothetical protein
LHGAGWVNFHKWNDWESEIRDKWMIEHVGEREDSEELGISLSFSLHLLTRRSSRERERECVILTTKSESCCARVCVCISTWSIYWTQTERERERERERAREKRFVLEFRAFKFLLLLFLSFFRTYSSSLHVDTDHTDIWASMHARISKSIISGSLYITYPFDYWTPKTADRPTDHPWDYYHPVAVRVW